MDKINFENLPSTSTPLNADTLNEMQENIEKSVVAVGSTQPSTSEKVWIKRSNNLYDENTMLEFTGKYRAGNSGNIIVSETNKGLKMPSEPNTTYTITQTGATDYHEVCFFDKNFNYLSGTEATSTQITTPANCYIMTIQTNINATNIMVNRGATAIPYEPYVRKEILVKNDNNIFEKFYDEKPNITQVTLGTEYIDSNLTQIDFTNIDFSLYKAITVQLGFPSEGDSKIFLLSDNGEFVNNVLHLDMYANDRYYCKAFANLYIHHGTGLIRINPKELAGWDSVTVTVKGLLK